MSEGIINICDTDMIKDNKDEIVGKFDAVFSRPRGYRLTHGLEVLETAHDIAGYNASQGLRAFQDFRDNVKRDSAADDLACGIMAVVGLYNDAMLFKTRPKNNIEACRKVFDLAYETIKMGDTLDGTEGRSTDEEEEDAEDEAANRAREEANAVPSIE